MYPQVKSHNGRSGRNSRCFAIAVFAAVSVLAACSPAADQGEAPAVSSAPAGTPAAAAPSKQQAAVRMQECREKLEAAVSLDLVGNASVDNGRPILWVGPAWRGSTREAQEELVRDAACFFLSGDESKTIKFSVYDTATDRELAVWNHTHLIIP